MKETLRTKALDYVVSCYLQSNDFNGCLASQLKNELSLSDPDTRDILAALIEDGLIDIMCSKFHPNPHIKAFSSIPIPEQLKVLEEEDVIRQCCVYPTRKAIEGQVETLPYQKAPFSSQLALGAGQLDYRIFDISVLELYRNDPRYKYETDGINGFISISDEYYESESVPEHDQVLLQTFGFAYDKDLNRAVAVFLGYLHDLSPEHQNIWAAKELKGDYRLHPDYYRNSILGEWGEKISIFDAFLQELCVINRMTEIMDKPPLFRNTFAENAPKGFGFLLRPTLKEFNSFVLLLDKMISDNLNKEFFRRDIPLKTEDVQEDGKAIVRHHGTIKLLEKWIRKFFRPQDASIVDEMITALRKVRRLRQKPAHSVNDDKFDQEYFKKQRQLIFDTYGALRTLRLILANHPMVKATPPEIGKHLLEGLIWDI